MNQKINQIYDYMSKSAAKDYKGVGDRALRANMLTHQVAEGRLRSKAKALGDRGHGPRMLADADAMARRRGKMESEAALRKQKGFQHGGSMEDIKSLKHDTRMVHRDAGRPDYKKEIGQKTHGDKTFAHSFSGGGFSLQGTKPGQQPLDKRGPMKGIF
jgi:hypothetical protein